MRELQNKVFRSLEENDENQKRIKELCSSKSPKETPSSPCLSPHSHLGQDIATKLGNT